MNNGWQTVTIGEVAKPVERAEAPMAGTAYRQIGVRLWGQGAYERETIDGSETKYATLSRVESGDIIVNKIWARNGSVAVVSNKLSGCFGSGEFPTFVPDRNRLAPRWFHWMTKTKWLWQACDEKSQGTSGKNRIRPEKFLEIEIPLPSLDEQHHIVERIETLAAQIANAQSLREEADYEAETISISTRNQIFSKLQSKVAPVRFDTFADLRLGKMLSEKSKTGVNPKPYLRNANVQWDSLNLSNVYEMDFDENEQNTFRLKTGDILVCEGGDIGKSAIWNDELEECYFQKALHRIRVDQIKTLPRFVLYHIFWGAEQGHFADMKTQTTIAHLTGVKLKSYNILLPPLDEQRRIVAYLDSVQARLASLRELQSAAGEELDALLPSVLDRAFKGEL